MTKLMKQSSSCIYIVDQDHRLIFFNETLKKDFPDVVPGDLCYKVLRGKDTPCKNCPIHTPDNQQDDSRRFYNKFTNDFLTLEMTPIEFPGHGSCYLLIGRIVAHFAQNPVTGLPTRDCFFKTAKDVLKAHPETDYCMAAIDIDHFKLFNEWYGEEVGNKFLHNISRCLLKVAQTQKSAVGHLGSDDFAILLPYSPENIQTLQSEITDLLQLYGETSGFLPAFGIYMINDPSIPVSTMYDRALIALSSVKGSFNNRVGWYDNRMKQDMEDQQKLLTEIRYALLNDEFTFYAQPKCNVLTGKIVGLESLVRWIHPTRGVVTPNEFVPMLEHNGFITNLDIYIWDKVCSCLRELIDDGYQALPISVNISRVDIYALNVVEHFQKLIKKYNLPPRLIEIEITESAYAEEFDIITRTVDSLRQAGFTVLMDDFGSGYSSLNMLKDVNVDVLKIDIKFLDINENSPDRGIGILEAIGKMARLMNLRMIAEGVETQKQVDFLTSIGCLYTQGYYFYRPLPIDEIKKLLSSKDNIDDRGLTNIQTDFLHLQDFFDNDIFTETVLNNILGGVAFIEIYEDQVHLRRANELFYKITDLQPTDSEESLEHIMHQIFPEDQGKAMEIFQQSRKDPTNGASGEFRHLKKDGSVIWLHIRTFYVREQNDHVYYYCIINDITVSKTYELNLRKSGEQMEQLLHQADINNWEWNLASDILTVMNSEEFFPPSPHPWMKTQDHRMTIYGFPDNFLLEEFIPFGYNKIVRNFLEEVRTNRSGQSLSCEFPLSLWDEKVAWINCVCETLLSESGVPRKVIGYYEDISRKKLERQKHHESMIALEILRKQSLYDFHINLTTDTMFDRLSKQKWMAETGCYEDLPFSQLLIYLSNGFILPKYTDSFLQFTDRERLLQLYKGEDLMESFDYQRLYNNAPHWMRMIIYLTRHEDSTDVIAYMFIMDINREMKQQMYLTQLAERDTLTGLYNRQTAITLIDQYLEDLESNTAALIMLDMDNFKNANDIFGHAYGDSLLAQTGAKLKSFFRSDDITCRIGGDEFLIFCKNIRNLDMAAKLERLISEATVIRRTQDRDIVFTLSAGYVMIPEHGTEFNDLYQKADIALFSAKMSGKNSFLEYSPDMKTVRPELADKEWR